MCVLLIRHTIMSSIFWAYFYAFVGERIMFSGCPSVALVCYFVLNSSGQILLPRYLTNGLSDLDAT